MESTLCREEEKDTASGKLLNAWLLTILQVHFTCQYRSRWYPSGESIIVLDGVQSVSLIILPMYLRSISLCLALRFKTQLDIFLGSVEDLPGLTGFNNTLDGGDCRWRSSHDGLANKFKVAEQV